MKTHVFNVKTIDQYGTLHAFDDSEKGEKK
jgi:hypothetical protein